MSKILVVEDDAGILLGLVRNLEFEGYTVFSSATGEEGLRLALDKQPDLIILDIMLPDISGTEICRLLRREGLEIPILFLSALGEERDKVEGLRLGAHDELLPGTAVVAGKLDVNEAATARLTAPTEKDQLLAAAGKDATILEVLQLDARGALEGKPFYPVRDFIDVYFASWDWHFPTFNVADSCISVGAVLLLLSSFVPRRPGPGREPEEAPQAEKSVA